MFTNLYYWVNYKRSFKLRLKLEKITLLALLDEKWSAKLKNNVRHFIKESNYSTDDEALYLFAEVNQQVDNYVKNVDSGDITLQLFEILKATKNTVTNEDIVYDEGNIESKKLKELQKIIGGGESITADGSMADRFQDMVKEQDSKDKALQEYWSLCESDENIFTLMQKYEMSRNDLNDLYNVLVDFGLGQWVKGHYVALSAFAYSEPLYYLLESQKRGLTDDNFFKMTIDILAHISGELPEGELYKRLQ